MRRILEPGKIESFAQRATARVRPPDRTRVFAARACRLRQLGRDHTIAEYLQLMAALADAQQAALASCGAKLPGDEQIAHARSCALPLLHTADWSREDRWRHVLDQLCEQLSAQPRFPGSVREVCERLRRSHAEELELRADALLAACRGAVVHSELDIGAAPFIMAALQVYWADLASRVPVENALSVDVRRVCPMCGTLPVASVVRADQQSQGHRYLHCALCATEWHMVRVTCSDCEATKDITYQSVAGGCEAVRAECCGNCRIYRKILYQEKDGDVEPLADDLASLALDLLLSEAGYHRGSGNPLLWQAAGG